MSQNPCLEALARVYEYLDNELAPEDAAVVKRHFEACGVCNDFLHFCDQFQQAIQRVACEQAHAPPELHARIQKILRETRA
jgi:mycothiol system anti-sigma-R factor